MLKENAVLNHTESRGKIHVIDLIILGQRLWWYDVMATNVKVK